eukprot:jgi/Mesen1/3167/ME000184S02235
MDERMKLLEVKLRGIDGLHASVETPGNSLQVPGGTGPREELSQEVPPAPDESGTSASEASDFGRSQGGQMRGGVSGSSAEDLQQASGSDATASEKKHQESSTLLQAKDDPKLARFLRMLRVGVPLSVRSLTLAP